MRSEVTGQWEEKKTRSTSVPVLFRYPYADIQQNHPFSCSANITHHSHAGGPPCCCFAAPSAVEHSHSHSHCRWRAGEGRTMRTKTRVNLYAAAKTRAAHSPVAETFWSLFSSLSDPLHLVVDRFSHLPVRSRRPYVAAAAAALSPAAFALSSEFFALPSRRHLKHRECLDQPLLLAGGCARPFVYPQRQPPYDHDFQCR